MSNSRNQQFLKRQKAKSAKKRTLQERNAEQADSILKDLFPRQRQFILDPYKRKSLLCPRRAGKTHVAIAYACYIALLEPDSYTPIVTLTLKSAKKLYWKPLKEFNEKYGLGMEFRIGDQMVVLPNGSRIGLHGADNLSDIERLRGGSYKLAIIDECKSIREEIFVELIDEVLSPAAGDADGTIALTGTPGKALDGLFYQATQPNLRDEDTRCLLTRDYYEPEEFWEDPPLFDGEPVIPQWSRHHWTSKHNIFKPQIWTNALAEKRRKQWSNDNPVWVREWLGRWVSSGDTFVYALQSLIESDGLTDCRALWWRHPEGQKCNRWGLPIPHGDDWEFVMGMDLGFNDHFAIVVMAYSPTHRTLYQVYEFKQEHLIVPQMAQAVKSAYDYCDGRVVAMVADTGGLGKLVVETLNTQYGFSIEAAQKTEKFDHIELFNSDMHEGLLKVLASSELKKEMMKLQWDFRNMNREKAIRTGKLREDQTADNHLCDAALYTWRFCFHHYGRAPEPDPDPGSPEWYERWDALEAEEAAAYSDPRFQPEYTSAVLSDMLNLNRLMN